MVRASPSFRAVLGCQPRTRSASAISGQRWTGSSIGSGRRVVGELGDRGLDRVAEIDRAGDVVGSGHQREEAVDQIIDIAEGAGLAAIAIEGDWRALQGLDD